MGRVDADTLYGTLKVLILKALSEGALHGLAISRRLHDASDESLHIEEGALYPALHRLERDGLLAAEWGVSENNRRAKFYAMTARGRRELRQEVASWTRHAEAVSKVLGVTVHAAR